MQRGIDHFSGDSVQLTCDVHLRLDVVGQVFIWEDIVNAVTSKTNELWSVSKKNNSGYYLISSRVALDNGDIGLGRD